MFYLSFLLTLTHGILFPCDFNYFWLWDTYFGRPNNVPSQRCPHPNLHGYITFRGKRDFADIVKTRVLREGDYPAVSGCTPCDHWGPWPWRKEAGDARESVPREAVLVVWCEKNWTCPCWLWRWKKEPSAKGWGQHLETGEGQRNGCCP